MARVTPSSAAPSKPVAVRHVWERYGDPTLDASGNPVNWLPIAEGHSKWGYLQYVIEGVDVTYLYGAPTPEPDWGHAETFGYEHATFRFPQVTTFRTRPSWARGGRNVQIWRYPGNGTRELLYEGLVSYVSDRRPGGILTLECDGLLYSADWQLRKPTTRTAPRDIGALIADSLNKVVSRRYRWTDPVATGMMTSVSGGWENILTEFIPNLLATAVKGGKQLTVAMDGRKPVIRFKNRTTVNWRVQYGQRGVIVDLASDLTESATTIYGEGINDDGGAWAGWKYPNARPDDTPRYPFYTAGKTIRYGTRDSDTDTGDGVSVLQAKLGVKVTGRISRSDVRAIRRAQTAGGIQVDGICGPQTWATLFATGSNTGSLEGAFIAPLACAKEVEPYRYGPDGDRLGANSAYNPKVPRIERKIEYGRGTNKADAITNAIELLARDADAGLQGSITFEGISPEQLHRFKIMGGQNCVVENYPEQGDVKLHVVRVRHSSGKTIVDVDTKARDMPMLQAIRERQKSATDPARLARKRLLDGKVSSDKPIYDSESPAGIVPRFPVFSNLWTVLRIPAGSAGHFVDTVFRTTAPKQAISAAVFGKRITANQLQGLVGNVLTTTATESPWEVHADELKEKYAILNSWGWTKQPGGYSPRSFSNAEGETPAPVTGRLEDDATWEYATKDEPWLYVAFLCRQSGYVEGHMRIAKRG